MEDENIYINHKTFIRAIMEDLIHYHLKLFLCISSSVGWTRYFTVLTYYRRLFLSIIRLQPYLVKHFSYVSSLKADGSSNFDQSSRQF